MADRDGSDGYIAGEHGPSSHVQRLTRRYRSWPLWAKISVPVAALLLMGALLPNDEANSSADGSATTQVAAATVVTSAATTSTPTTTTLAPVTTIPATTFPATTFPATTLPATTLPPTTLAPVTTPAPAPEPVVTPAPAPIAPQPIVVIPAPAPEPAPALAPAPAAGSTRYGTCKEAKAHGGGPYYAGSVEYTWYRDADNDNMVCE